MNKNILLFKIVPLIFLFISCGNKTVVRQTAKTPNIIIILADDLGYADLGCYGNDKIETPNINKLAKEGMMFTQHYSGDAVCAPSRCVLLTGKHSGHSDIRNNNPWASRGNVWSLEAMTKDSTLEGQPPMRESTITFASILKKAGYKTGMSGKWGLGAPNTSSTPLQKGFDFFIGYNCQRVAHTYYPPFLYKNNRRLYLDNKIIPLSEKLPGSADPYDEHSYARYTQKDYSPDIMYREIEDFITKNKDTTFFFYWATPIPHVALQAPKPWVDYYVKKFGDEKPYTGGKGYYPSRYPHATYAGMISYLDENIGKLVAKLKELGIYDNTLIIFTSDNGPTFNGGADAQWFNSGGMLGSGSREIKGSLDDGGVRIPMIAEWPGKIKPGVVSNHVSAFWDIFPTFCDLTGVQTPEGLDGLSMLPTLLGRGKQKKHEYLYWELGRNQAIRMGNWKAVRQLKGEERKIKLYNLKTDIKERDDVADQNPEVVKKMEEIFAKARTTPSKYY
ncbi:MAG: N-acetylgalactosamine-6-sulfatase [Flavobacteriia bacterium]|nr:MAG: N-acetylgalactosamine-6-sulfatase [Flavobacteriia bacterium]